MAGELAIRILGPVELWRDGSPVAAGGPTQRAVLAMLALRAGQPVPLDELADGIWGEGEQPAGGKGIQVHVSRLRSLLKHGRRQPIQTVPGGYRLEPDAVTLDSADFEHRLAEGRARLAAGEPQAAADTLAAGLALWRGPALMDVRDFPFAAHAAVRYDELRVDAAEAALAARLALGEHQALVPELQALIAEHPYRERLHGLLMTALYRAGQQAAALEAYTAARSRLVLDLGVEPGPEMQALQQQILAQDPSLLTEATATLGADDSRAIATRTSPAPRLPPERQLFGREALLAELVELAAGERLITLTGAGGSGKTALALALAHRLAPRYPDGAALADLAAVARPDYVLPALAAALGVTPEGGSLAELLATILAEQRRLVVLDNCEHLLDAVPHLSPLVEATAGVVIATSRVPLRLRAECLVTVPALEVPLYEEAPGDPSPAVRLFLHAAAAVGGVVDESLAELAAVGRICRALDGLPLALEITAAQTRLKSVDELADSLRQRLPALRSPIRDVSPRQRTMEAAVGWSTERLPAETRDAFSAISILAGSFDIGAATAVTALDGSHALQQVDLLLETSLLVRQPIVNRRARFRMLEPIRSVAHRELIRLGRLHSVAARSAKHFAAVAKAQSPARKGICTPAALEELRADSANLVDALTYLLDSDPSAAVELVESLSHYWAWSGENEQALRWSERLLALDDLSPRSRAVMSIVAAGAGYSLRNLSSTIDHARQALELGRQLHDSWIVASAEARIANLADDQGDTKEALRAGRTAVDAARRTDDPDLLAYALMTLAFAESAEPRWRLADEAIALARTDGAPSTRWTVLLYRGNLESEERRFEAARHSYQEAAEIAARFHSAEREAYALGNLGNVNLRLGRVSEAHALFQRTLGTLDRARSVWLGPNLEALGEIAAVRGDWDRALLLLGAADEILQRWGATRDAPEAEELAGLLVRARAALGAATADQLLARGRRMSRHEAVELALGVR